MKRRSVLVLGCAGIGILGLARGGPAAPADGTPEAVVARALDALNHDRVDEFVRAMHPEALKQFRAGILEVVDGATRDGKADELLPLFQGVKDVSGLKALDGPRLLASYLRGTIGANPQAKSALAKAEVRVLGHVAEGGETQHVPYRLKMEVEGVPLDRIYVTSVRKDGPAWRLLLPSDLEGGVAMMKQKMAGKFAVPDFAASKIEPLGHLLEGETGHVVYRITIPAGEASLTKLAVFSVGRDTPDWALVREGKTAEVVARIRQSLGLK